MDGMGSTASQMTRMRSSVTGTERPEGSSTSTRPILMTILGTVDWNALPMESQRMVRKLAPMICAGFSMREIAQHFGRSNDWMAARIRELREDILDQVNAND